MRKQTIENKIDALFLASEITINEPLREDIARNLNKLNLEYLKRYNHLYTPINLTKLREAGL